MSRISLWQRIPLRVQGLLFNSLPLIAVLITAAFAYFSNQQREQTEMSLNRHFEAVENLVDVHISLLNAEAALNSYLLTQDSAHLQPAFNARTLVPQKLARVRTLVESIQKPNLRALKLARLDSVRAQVDKELESLASLSAAPTKPTNTDAKEIAAQIRQNQPLLESISRQLGILRGAEQRLLAKRIEEIRSIRQRDYLLIFLSVFIGLVSRAVALYFFHRRVIRRVRQLTENVRNLRDGATLVHEPSDHADDIGELERELARASEFLAERRLGS